MPIVLMTRTGPQRPGSGTSAPGESDPGARLRRALSRNTLLPQDVPSTSKGTGDSGSQPSSASQGKTFIDKSSNCGSLLLVFWVLNGVAQILWPLLPPLLHCWSVRLYMSACWQGCNLS